MLTIFRGDDLAFAEYNRKVCVRFNTCQDLTGWSAKFYLLDNLKETDDISSRLWTFGYTAEETATFPLGKTFGKLVIFDQSKQVRQMAKVEVEIVNQRLEPCINGFIAISIDNVVADYNCISNKPEINGVVIQGSHDSEYYGLASADALQATDAHLQRLQEQVDNLPPSHDYSHEIEMLSQRITAETIEREQADAALEESISAEQQTREAAVADLKNELEAAAEALDEDIAQERIDREKAISSLIAGETPISSLLFIADGDDENYYRLRIVMADDGAGGLLPTIELDTVPIEDESSDSDSDSSSDE